jgi:hypothetical protein
MAVKLTGLVWSFAELATAILVPVLVIGGLIEIPNAAVAIVRVMRCGENLECSQGWWRLAKWVKKLEHKP